MSVNSPLQQHFANPETTAAALRSIKRRAGGVQQSVLEMEAQHRSDWIDVQLQQSIEQCYRELAMLLEIHGLTESRHELLKTLRKQHKVGLLEPGGDDFDDIVLSVHYLNEHIDPFLQLVDRKHSTTIKIKLESVLNELRYAVNHPSFGSEVDRELTFHHRCYAVLRPLYPDLQWEPQFTGGVKNYKADLGIASLKSLLELKYLKEKKDLGKMIDAIKADLLGYGGAEWQHLFVVAYERSAITSPAQLTALFKGLDFGLKPHFIVVPSSSSLASGGAVAGTHS